jgi:hypothetical protein
MLLDKTLLDKRTKYQDNLGIFTNYLEGKSNYYVIVII